MVHQLFEIFIFLGWKKRPLQVAAVCYEDKVVNKSENVLSVETHLFVSESVSAYVAERRLMSL